MSRSRPRAFSAPPLRGPCSPRKRQSGSTPTGLALQSIYPRPRTFPRNWRTALPFAISTRRAPARLRRSFSLGGRPQFHTCTPRLRKSNGNRLLGVPHTVFALANFFNFRTDKLTGLCARRFALARVPTRARNVFFVRHDLLSRRRGRSRPAIGTAIRSGRLRCANRRTRSGIGRVARRRSHRRALGL